MTGVVAAMAGAGAGPGGINTAFAADLSFFGLLAGIYTVSVTFAPDGSASTVGGGTPAGWYLPATPNIGAGWSVRVTGIGSGTTVSGMVSGTWYPLTTPRTVAYSNAAPVGEGYGTAAVAFSPDGGTTVIAAGSIAWDVTGGGI